MAISQSRRLLMASLASALAIHARPEREPGAEGHLGDRQAAASEVAVLHARHGTPGQSTACADTLRLC